MMVIGLVATGVFGALPLVLTAPLAFVLLRAGAGLSAAIYDPAARGYLTDATPPGKRGEAFGLYGAAQMGGLLLGPAIGAFGAANFGGIGFVFVFSAVAAIAAAALIALRVRETPDRTHPAPAAGLDRVPAGFRRHSPAGPPTTSMPTAPGRRCLAPDLALEPRPHRGDRHQRRRLLRRRHVRGHLEPVPRSTWGRTSRSSG